MHPICEELVPFKLMLAGKKNVSLAERVEIYNQAIKLLSDFLALPHPAVCPQLLPVDAVRGNDYNPNKVAPPEMRLLTLSMLKDGMTMPSVVCPEGKKWVVVDGFHRRTVAATNATMRKSLGGYLVCTILDKPLEDRITATVRHNMARGTHQVELSANLVVMLKKNNWSNERIGKELGMDPDEVLRLKQVTGLAEAFQNQEFSRAWE